MSVALDTSSLVLHRCRTDAELDAALLRLLRDVASDLEVLVAVREDGVGERVRFAWPSGLETDADALASAGFVELPIIDGEFTIGRALVRGCSDEELQARIAPFLRHYAVALVHLACDSEARVSATEYCATLQALEEGVVLFQEADPEVVLASLLELAGRVADAPAGLLFVYDEIGDSHSQLQLRQSLAVPEPIRQAWEQLGESAPVRTMLAADVVLHRRGEDGALAGLPESCLVPALHALVAVPLRYHGVDAGLCLLMNPEFAQDNESMRLSRLHSFGQLGAALLHRLALERVREESVSIARELSIAETIQRRLVPTAAPHAKGYEFAWHTLAARSIGGDYVDFVVSDLGDVYACVADAAGHGINSALLMTSFRSNYRGRAPWVEPCELGAALNDEVAEEVGPTGMFITSVLARIEANSGDLSLCSTGHNPSMLFRAASGEVEQIESHGPPLGFLAGCEYEQYETVMQHGDVLVLYTDGVTETLNAEGEMYGEERLSKLVAEHAGSDGAQQLLERILWALELFSEAQENSDDVSVMVIRRD